MRRRLRLHYHHQNGVCCAGSCLGHTARYSRHALAHLGALRLAGRLAYIRPARRLS